MEKFYNAFCRTISEAKDLDEGAITPEIPLHQFKLDSLDYVELMVEAKKLGATLSADSFKDKPDMTLGELCHSLAEQSEQKK